MTKNVALALSLFLFLQTLSITPAAAQSGFVWAHVVVQVNNKDNGTPVPSRTVYLTELSKPSDRMAGAVSRETNADGIASLTFLGAPGTWEVKIFGGSFFSTYAGTLELVPGQNEYQVFVELEPKAQRPSLNSNKYINQQGRLLHVKVIGSQGGKNVPVHYASIFDNTGKKIATTGYDGTAVVRHNEAIGETVTLRAEPASMPGNDQWEPGSASFIVGAVEKGLRTTQSEDHVTIVLGRNGQTSEKHPLDVIVRGMKNGKRIRIANASIVDAEGHKLGTTDSLGRATVTVDVPLGETYSVKAEAKHWQSESETLQSGHVQAGITPTYAHESVEFMLQPAVETGALTVEVLDQKTDAPIPGATVTLYKPNKFPGTKIESSSTNGKGEARFDAEEIDRALLNGEARIEASHDGYATSAQTVAQDLTTGDAPRYTLYLKNQREQRGALQGCNGADSALHAKIIGTWKGSLGPVTFSGPCENVSGFWMQGEWGDPVRNNGTDERGVISRGRVSRGVLTFQYSQYWNQRKGSDSCYLSNDGKTLNCSYLGTLSH